MEYRGVGLVCEVGGCGGERVNVGKEMGTVREREVKGVWEILPCSVLMGKQVLIVMKLRCSYCGSRSTNNAQRVCNSNAQYEKPLAALHVTTNSLPCRS